MKDNTFQVAQVTKAQLEIVIDLFKSYLVALVLASLVCCSSYFPGTATRMLAWPAAVSVFVPLVADVIVSVFLKGGSVNNLGLAYLAGVTLLSLLYAIFASAPPPSASASAPAPEHEKYHMMEEQPPEPAP